MNNSLFLDLLIPNQCIQCHRLAKHGLCSPCLSSISARPGLILPTSPTLPIFRSTSHNTVTTHTKSHIQSILCATSFQIPLIRHAIHMFKYKNLSCLAYPLSRLLLQAFVRHYLPHSQVRLCPVPLHPKRHRFRGYNQAELLTNHLASDLKVPVFRDLIRVKNTTQQMRYTHKRERLQNMKDSFFCPPMTVDTTSPIILIDDVTTTLSTLEESAKALSKAGFTSVHGLIISH